MPRRTGKVTVDTTALARDTKRLVAGLKSGGYREGRAQADRTAAKVRDYTPVRTGALRSTVGVTPSWVNAARGGPGGAGWGVTYGSGVVYHYVQNARLKIVKRGLRGARPEFQRACDRLAAAEIGRL